MPLYQFTHQFQKHKQLHLAIKQFDMVKYGFVFYFIFFPEIQRTFALWFKLLNLVRLTHVFTVALNLVFEYHNTYTKNIKLTRSFFRILVLEVLIKFYTCIKFDWLLQLHVGPRQRSDMKLKQPSTSYIKIQYLRVTVSAQGHTRESAYGWIPKNLGIQKTTVRARVRSPFSNSDTTDTDPITQ